MHKKRCKKEGKGFTLVELLTVVVILALITAIAVPSFSKIQKSVRKKQYNNKLDLIKVAALKYADDTNYTSFYIDDLVVNGYLEADKIENTNSGKLYLVVDDHEGEEKIMNCYIVTIQEKNGVLDANISESVTEGNKNYKENEGCAVNLPNNVNEYFDIKLQDKENGAWKEFNYDKYGAKWWTKNDVRITINGKNGNTIDSIEWYEGASLEPIPNGVSENYFVSNNSIEIGKNVGSVLQQNYTAKIQMNGNEYSVTTRVYIDRVKPEYYENSNNNLNDKWVKKAEYTINAYDNESGLYSYFMEKEDNLTICPTDKNDYTIKKKKIITDTGNYYACLIDYVGNVKQSDLLKFDKIDGANMQCNILLNGSKKIANSIWYTSDVTLTVVPRTDSGFSVGASGLKIGINDKIKTWPTAPYYKEVSKTTFDNNPSSAAVSIIHSNDVNGKYYYGHIKNEAGEDKVCAKKIYIEKNITAPSNVSNTSDYELITIQFTRGDAISGINEVKCHRLNGSGGSIISTIDATLVNGNTYKCAMAVPSTTVATNYYFKVSNKSVAGNEAYTNELIFKNKGLCDSTKVDPNCSSQWNWSTCTNVCGGGTQYQYRSCNIVSEHSPTTICGSKNVTQNENTSCGGKAWTEPTWNNWSSCNNKCTQTRTRAESTCMSTISAGTACTGCTGTKPVSEENKNCPLTDWTTVSDVFIHYDTYYSTDNKKSNCTRTHCRAQIKYAKKSDGSAGTQACSYRVHYNKPGDGDTTINIPNATACSVDQVKGSLDSIKSGYESVFASKDFWDVSANEHYHQHYDLHTSCTRTSDNKKCIEWSINSQAYAAHCVVQNEDANHKNDCS